ncbi:helix-turn-helix domain-containing protein [Conexibacter sp. JD483]|uniref:PucR family transcriptional regulator n=1 Tax=unclassified Conexibacter TaxID=2627773 RepID=UPI00271FA2DA|nr:MULTISPECIES: helix-turn-helix domain-containing protein [unclassified Conexibacter]MDO8189091.1 helix-turn-helix domain-containing protein [Conexibacter sp. CPCC 205706]MDO8201862.1 helix-turn-helix domain-containing protein [Conexibacter sp. CPCC 205762]MDR9372783.1 helix-turn-helix domain-containing protein [Conexibacter sp. JD483]
MSDWRELAAELAEDGDRIGLLAGAVTDQIVAGLPLAADEELAEATRRSVADNIWLFASMAAAGIPPERAAPRTLAEEFVRLLARRGIGADTVAASYRLALNGFWEGWTRLLRERVPPQQLADALDASIRWMLTFVNALSERVIAIHEQERRAWVRSGEAVRAQTIRELLDGVPTDLRLAESRLGYPLDRTHICAVGWSDPAGEESPDLGLLANALATRLHVRSLTLHVDRETVAVWASGYDGHLDRDALADLDAVAARGVSLAIGRAHPGLDGFRWSYREAMHARRVALLERRPAGAAVRYDQVALQALASADVEQARRFVAWQLGPLAGDDDASRALAETLRAYLLHESNLRAAAAHLGIHHNTVANRLRRAAELLGAPLAERSAELLTALALVDATRAGSAAGDGDLRL